MNAPIHWPGHWRISEIVGDPRAIHLVRHGETALNARGVLQGSIDVPLNARGQAQAAATATRLQGQRIRAIVSSPQLRARQTADIIGRALGLAVTEHGDLRERSWGIYEGQLRDERDDHGEGVEPMAALRRRAGQAFISVTQYATPPLAIVTHSGFIRALLAELGTSDHRPVGNGEIITLTPVGIGHD